MTCCAMPKLWVWQAGVLQSLRHRDLYSTDAHGRQGPMIPKPEFHLEDSWDRSLTDGQAARFFLFAGSCRDRTPFPGPRFLYLESKEDSVWVFGLCMKLPFQESAKRRKPNVHRSELHFGRFRVSVLWRSFAYKPFCVLPEGHQSTLPTEGPTVSTPNKLKCRSV